MILCNVNRLLIDSNESRLDNVTSQKNTVTGIGVKFNFDVLNVYFHVGIYASAASAVFFSFPVQMITFINWQRHAYKESVVFKSMSIKLRIAAAGIFALVWAGVFAATYYAKSEFAFLDTTATLLGITVSLLTALAYIEYSYLWLVSCGISLLLSLQITLKDRANIMFLVSSVYNFYSVICAFINVRKLYSQQSECETE